jgi:glycosyltransferase involved in cell wall biosynthesis
VNIGLDVAVAARPGGIAAYALALVAALGDVARQHRLVLWGGRGAAPALRAVAPANARVLESGLRGRYADVVGRLRWLNPLSIESLVGDVDVFHGLNYLVPAPRSRAPVVITIHDLSAFTHPEWHPRPRALAHRWVLRRTAVAAAHVITPTEAIRAEAIETLGLDPARVTAIPLGVSAMFRPRSAADVKPVLDRHGLTFQGYALYGAALEPRKNLPRVLDAVALLRRRRSDAPPLVVAGPAGWRNDAIRARLAEPGIRYVGYLDREELAALMAGSLMFLYASLYEGFGLPALEALASGAPVLASTDPALTEVVGDDAVRVDPGNVDAIASGMARLVDDRDLRNDLARRGPRRAQAFTWSRTAARTLALYEAVRAR